MKLATRGEKATAKGARSAPTDPNTSADPRLANLPTLIHERITKRLSGRIYDLSVSVDAKTIRLEGRCATYHSKQLAQHAALGVIEDEVLDNAIEVKIPR